MSKTKSHYWDEITDYTESEVNKLLCPEECTWPENVNDLPPDELEEYEAWGDKNE